MIPERRLDRAERLLLLVIKAGDRERREWRQRSREQEEKLNIAINAHIEHVEQMDKRFALAAERMEKFEAAQARTDRQIEKLAAEIAEGHKITKWEIEETQRELRAFIKSMRKGQNGGSSN